MRRLLIATALLLVAPLVAAQAYKWKDANGTVHYSDAPPPQGTNYSKVTTTGSVAPISQPVAGASSDAASAPSGNGNPPPSNQPMADTPENRAKFCAALKSNLDALRGSGPVVVSQNGQQKVLEGEQRQQQQNATETQYKQYCPNG